VTFPKRNWIHRGYTWIHRKRDRPTELKPSNFAITAHLPATIKLMGYSQVVRGHVGSVASGINVPNARPDQAGLASVDPIFTWVRLAQRVPVHIQG